VLTLMIEAFLEAKGTKAERRLKAPLTLISKPCHQSSGSEAAMEWRSGMYPALAMRISIEPTADLIAWNAVSSVLFSVMSAM